MLSENKESVLHETVGDYGYALAALKNGYKLARKGWNGKGMWISLTTGRVLNNKIDKIWTENVKKAAEENNGIVEMLPYLLMKTADNKIQIGWLANQSDMLANDWGIVD